MKKIAIILVVLTFFFQISIKPVKSFSNSDLLGIKYTIWDDEYEEKNTTTKIIYYSISFVVVGTISFLIMSKLKKHIGDTKPVETKPSIINAVEDISSDRLYSVLTNENISQLKEKLFLRYVDYKTSYMNYDYNKIQSICTTSFYNNTINELNNLITQGLVNISHTFVSKKVIIGDIHEEGNLIVIDFYLLVNYYNYTIDKNKNVVAGRQLESIDESVKIEYVITKNKDNITCLNCGKKVYLEKDGQCPYCSSPVTIEAKDYLIRSITKC